MGVEREAARERHGFLARRRYRPEQWDRVASWRTYRVGQGDRWFGRVGQGDRWFGFEAVRDLDGLPPEILLIPLPGHTWGHAGVAIDTTEGWLLNAADTYFHRHEVDRPHRQCPPGPRAYQRMMAVNPDLHRHNRDRVRALARDRDAAVRVFCSHDAAELEALSELSGRPALAQAQ